MTDKQKLIEYYNKTLETTTKLDEMEILLNKKSSSLSEMIDDLNTIKYNISELKLNLFEFLGSVS